MPALLGPRAIIFDLDNTLVHSRIDFAAIRLALGVFLNEAGVSDGLVITDGPRRLSIGQLIDLGSQHDARHGTQLSSQMWELVEQYEREGMLLASVDSDAPTTLATLRRRGYALGVLTNNSRTSSLEALRKFGLIPYLDPILAREDVPAMKPSPSGLIVAQERLGLDAESLLFVGDSHLDALAAGAAGCPFVAFRPRLADLEHHGIEPHGVIGALEELLEIVPGG